MGRVVRIVAQLAADAAYGGAHGRHVAVAEVPVGGKRPDIMVRPPQAAPIFLEIDFEPAGTVQVDGPVQLGMELYGGKVQPSSQ